MFFLNLYNFIDLIDLYYFYLVFKVIKYLNFIYTSGFIILAILFQLILFWSTSTWR